MTNATGDALIYPLQTYRDCLDARGLIEMLQAQWPQQRIFGRQTVLRHLHTTMPSRTAESSCYWVNLMQHIKSNVLKVVVGEVSSIDSTTVAIVGSSRCCHFVSDLSQKMLIKDKEQSTEIECTYGAISAICLEVCRSWLRQSVCPSHA